MTTESAAQRKAHIQSVVASAPAPTPAQVQELSRLLTPVMLQGATVNAPETMKEKDEWDV